MNGSVSSARRRAAALAGAAAAAVVLVAGCSSPEPAASPKDAPPTLSSLGDLPDLTPVDTSWDHYRTAKITDVRGRADARTLDVTYEGSQADCEGLAGYAASRADGKVEVTVVLGEKDGCERGAASTKVTAVRLGQRLDADQAVPSTYSADSLDVG